MNATITQLLVPVVFFVSSCGHPVPPAQAASAAPALQEVPEPPPLGRLPENVAPTSYDLTLRLDPAQPRFSGSVKIAVDIKQKTKSIWLHGQDLHVAGAQLTLGAATPTNIEYTQVTPEGVAKLTLPQEVEPGPALLTLVFDGAYNTQLDGLYRVHTPDNNDYVFSQFEAIAARRAFPSFDEPRFKTPFQVTLQVPEALEAISNGPLVGEGRSGNGEKSVRFRVTEKLPTYLLAFAVGPFDVVEGADVPPNPWRKEPIPLRAVAVRGKGPALRYALANTGKLVELLEHYFQIGYPFRKLDIIAVPDFAAGAMENAGAITFRDWFLLLDPDTATSSQLRGFAEVVAHELTHQWFGDLVTMSWWDDLWLNEAFATWLGYATASHFDPSAHIDLEFRSAVLGAMDQDSFRAARQIRQPITSTHDIHDAFDAITYSKGGGVLAMFESYLGSERMQAGVSEHLHEFAFGNATAQDFLHSLAVGAKEDVSASFSTFLNQPGVPLVDLTWECDASGAQLNLSQQRYVPLGSTFAADNLWQVPVCLRYGGKAGDGRTCIMLQTAKQQARLSSCPSWVLPNANAAGYYRFGLAPRALEALSKAPLTPGESLALADSATAAFDAGTLDAAPVLQALAPLAASPIRAVAVSPIGLLRFIDDEVLGDGERAAAHAWMGNLYKSNVSRLGSGEVKKNAARDHGEDALLRRQVLGFLAQTVGDASTRQTLAAAGTKLIGFEADGGFHPEGLSPDLTDLAMQMAAEKYGAAYVDALITLLDKVDDPGERKQILGALAMIQDPALAEKIRPLTLDVRLRTNEVLRIIGAQMTRPKLRGAAWQFLKTNYDAIVARLAVSHQGSMPGVASHACDPTLLEDVRGFLSPRVASLPGAPRVLAQSIEAAEQCIARVAKQGDSVRAFFAGAQPPAKRATGSPSRKGARQ